MLKLLNLYVIDQIFERAGTKVSPLSKMVYLNCLMHYFKGKEATFEDSYGFNMHDSDFDFQAYKKSFHELDKAGLVSLNGAGVITFNNVWGQLIDRTQLKVSDNKRSWLASRYETKLLENTQLTDLCQMKYKLNLKQVTDLIALFVKEQDAMKKEYSNESECIKHCNFWIGKNVGRAKPKETVKSTGKLLGK